MNKFPVFVLVLCSAGGVILGDYAAKSWSITHNGSSLLMAWFGYFLSGFFYVPTLLREGLIVTSVLWVLLSTLGYLTIGFLIFKESLSVVQLFAVALGIISIFVLTIAD